MDKLINLGIKVRNARECKDYSTEQLARLTKVSSGTINNIENAHHDVFNLELLYRISSVLNIPVYEIISYDVNFIVNIIKSDCDDINKKKLIGILDRIIQFTNKVNNDNIKIDMLCKKILCEIDFISKLI